MATAVAVNLEQLRQFGIEPEEVLSIDGNPWLSSEQLTAIARQTGNFILIDVNLEEQKGDQVVCKATVTNKENQTFGRFGTASASEKLVTGAEVNADDLAASRALRSALAMAGVDPFKTAPIAPLKADIKPQTEAGARAIVRSNFIRQLHALAIKKGLIVGSDYSIYRSWLLENFDVESSANFDEIQFSLVINKMSQLKDA